MTSERDCFVYIVPPGATEFVTAGRFRWIDDGAAAVGQFVYGRSYRERADAVELDPVELRLSAEVYETARMQGFFGAIRDSMPDFWGRRVIERSSGSTELGEFDYLMLGPDDRAGALGFGPAVEPPAARRRFNRPLDLGALQQAADAVLADDREAAGASADRVEELLLPGTSMGGARPQGGGGARGWSLDCQVRAHRRPLERIAGRARHARPCSGMRSGRRRQPDRDRGRA